MFVRYLTAQRVSTSVDRSLVLAVVLALMALFVLVPGLQAQEAQIEPEQQAT